MKNKKTIIILFISLAILLLAYFTWTLRKANKFDWSETYRMESKEPYGTTVIRELLKSYHKNKKFEALQKSISKSFVSKKDSIPANYVFIGNDFEPNRAELDSLLGFVKSGNNAFISSKSIPNELMYDLYEDECGEWNGYYGHTDSVVRMNFYDDAFQTEKGYRFDFQYKDQKINYNWHCVDGNYFCDSLYSFEELGYIDSFYVNYIRVPFGKGNFLLHTSPAVFTNCQLLKEENLEYAEKVFSYLNDGDIYWDEYTKLQTASSDEFSGLSESPLKFILSQTSLRWAWYLTLSLVLLYVLFHAKRKQRVIPLTETNTNTSLEFVQTIGRLYYQQADHKKLARHKMKLFLNFIRNRYHLQTNNLDENLLQKITDKSELPRNLVEKIFNGIKLVNYTIVELTETELVEFHQSIDYFYKNCK